MPNRCLIKNCETNKRQSEDSYQVFGLPKDRFYKRKWLNIAVKPSDPGPPYGICSRHFSGKEPSINYVVAAFFKCSIFYKTLYFRNVFFFCR